MLAGGLFWVYFGVFLDFFDFFGKREVAGRRAAAGLHRIVTRGYVEPNHMDFERPIESLSTSRVFVFKNRLLR